MKFYATVALFAGLAAAAPVEIALEDAAPVEILPVDSVPVEVVPVDTVHVDLEARQSSSNQLEQGSSANCPEGILIFARGSTEPGNLGSSLGPALAGALRNQVSSLWVQGVGGPYSASLGDNVLPRGTSSAAIAEGVRLFNLARSKCPNSAIVTGGYSQGAALIAAAVSDLSSTVRNQVQGAVLFGYTKNQQNGGRIPNYPTDRTRIYCAQGDRVCEGTLIVAPPHFSYDDEARGVAATFLASRI